MPAAAGSAPKPENAFGHAVGVSYGSVASARSVAGSPSVASSQSSIATTSGESCAKMQLSTRKSPCTSVVSASSPAGSASGSHASSFSKAALDSVSAARYCDVHTFVCRAT